MGSIANIIARGPQPTNFGPTILEHARAQAQQEAELQQTRGRTALQTGQTQGVSLENQMRERDLRDQDIISKAWQETDGTPDTIIRTVVKRGASPKAAIGLMNAFTEQKKSLVGLKEADLKLQRDQHDQADGAIQAAIDAPPELKEQAWNAVKPIAEQFGVPVPDVYPGDAHARLIKGLNMTGSKLTAQALEDRKVAAQETTAGAKKLEAEAKAPGERAKSEIAQRQAEAMKNLTPENFGQIVDEIINPQQHPELNVRAKGQIQAALKFGMPLTAVNAIIKSASDEIGGTERAVTTMKAEQPLKLQQIIAGERIRGQVAQQMAEGSPMAKAIADYKSPPISPRSAQTPQGRALMDEVIRRNPGYDAKNYKTQSAMQERFTSGTTSREIGGINTALGHVGVLGDAIEALNNGDLVALNRLGNFLSVQTGQSPVTTFKAIVHKVAPELNRAYVGGVGSQGEIKDQESDFDPKLGPQQLRSNVAVTTRLLRSKIGSLENQWKKTMGTDFAERFLTPEADESIKKWGTPGAGGGGAKPAPAVGTIQKGYRFKGGDPAKPESWEKAQ